MSINSNISTIRVMGSNKPVLNSLFNSRYLSRPSNQTGFTLMELMITISIAGILTGLAIPSFNALIRSSRLTTSTNEFVTALNFARSEAVKRGVPVTVRKVDNNSATKTGGTSSPWQNGWDVFTDIDTNGIFSTNDKLLRTWSALNAAFTLSGGASASYIRFNALGGIAGSTSFTLCDNSSGNAPVEANTSRYITVISTGRVRIMPDTDDPSDGIPNKSGGENISSC